MCRSELRPHNKRAFSLSPPAPSTSRACLQRSMRRLLHATLRAAAALTPLGAAGPSAAAARAGAPSAPPRSSCVPPAVALAAARALSGIAAGTSASDALAPAAGAAGDDAAAEDAAAGATVNAAAAQRKELYMVFTCGRCDTRAVKGFSRQAYEHGAPRAQQRPRGAVRPQLLLGC